MFEGVVIAAEKFEVPEGGGPAVSPMPDVMDIAPLLGPVATRMGAMPIPGDHRPPHPRGDHPGGPADIDRLRLGSEHHPADGGVTGVSAYLFRGKDLPVGGFMNPATMALQSGEIG